MGSSAYIMELLRKVCVLIKLAHLWKDKLPCIPGDHTKLYLSPLLCEKQHRLYQHLVGMVEWSVQIGRFYIRFFFDLSKPFLGGSQGGLSQSVDGYLWLFSKPHWKTENCCYIARGYR